jgi:hypothetical protein
VRVKVKPKNPRSTIQQANRANFSTYTKAFRSLTAAQILGWNTVAAGTTLKDTLGNSYPPSGLQLYISCNRNLALLGLGPLSVAPTIKPSFPQILGVGSYATIANPSYWQVWIKINVPVGSISTELVCRVSKPQSRSINFLSATSYRNWGNFAPQAGYFISWQSDATHGLVRPTTSQLVWAQVRLVDAATGYSSMPETAVLPVTA